MGRTRWEAEFSWSFSLLGAISRVDKGGLNALLTPVPMLERGLPQGPLRLSRRQTIVMENFRPWGGGLRGLRVFLRCFH